MFLYTIYAETYVPIEDHVPKNNPKCKSVKEKIVCYKVQLTYR